MKISTCFIGGHCYEFHGWGGCQLRSFQFFAPPAGTRRELDFGDEKININIYRTNRVGLFVECMWAISSHGSIDEHNKRINHLRNKLQ